MYFYVTLVKASFCTPSLLFGNVTKVHLSCAYVSEVELSSEDTNEM